MWKVPAVSGVRVAVDDALAAHTTWCFVQAPVRFVLPTEECDAAALTSSVSILTVPTRHGSLAACQVRLPCRLSLSLSKRLTRVVQNQAILHEESI